MYAEITMVVEIMEDINNPSNKALLMEDITDADALVMKSYFVVGVRSIDAKEWAGKEKHRMASLRNHKIVETWKTVSDNKHLYHFTENNRVVRTGIQGGNAKLLFISEKGVLNFSGVGQRAVVADFRTKFDDMRGWDKIDGAY